MTDRHGSSSGVGGRGVEVWQEGGQCANKKER